MIYLTPFDPDTLQATDKSSDSGCETLGEVREMMGAEPENETAALMIYPGLLFSKIPFTIDGQVNQS